MRRGPDWWLKTKIIRLESFIAAASIIEWLMLCSTRKTAVPQDGSIVRVVL